MSDEQEPIIERRITHVPGFDHIMGGGLLVGSVYLVAGRPGAAKTILANQIAFSHGEHGGRSVYVTLLAESHARMLALIRTMSFFRPELVGVGIHYLSGYKTLEAERLVGLIDLLRAATRDCQATLLVIDGLLTARDVVESDIAIKRFLHELHVLAELNGCTVLILRGAHAPTENYPERTMADGLISLSTARVGMRSVREIEVEKHRGSGHVMGASFFEVSSAGLRIYPRSEATLGLGLAERDDDGAARLVPTGIASLDVLLRGGLPSESSTMVLGTSGIGKTLLGLQFLSTCAQRNEPCLYLGFGEAPPRLIRKAMATGLELAPHVASGTLDLQWRSPQEPLADRLAEELFENVRRRGVKCLMIDGFESFRDGLIHPERLRPFSSSLIAELHILGVTTLISEAVTAPIGTELSPPSGASEIADNILFLRSIERRSGLRRAISVFKMRDHDYDPSLRILSFTSRGIELSEPDSESSG